MLRDQKNLPGIWIFDLGSRGKAFYIHIFARRKWAFDEVLFAWNWNPIWKITFGDLARRRRSRRGTDRRLLANGVLRLHRSIRVKWLLLRRVLLLDRFLRITGDTMSHPWRWLVNIARRQTKQA